MLYDGLATRSAPLLRVDQLTANRAGEVFVCEDLADRGDRHRRDRPRAARVSRFLSVTGPEHVGSELTGVTFDPAGERMYFASQRAGGNGDADTPGPGAIYEVRGPFRGRQHSAAPPERHTARTAACPPLPHAPRTCGSGQRRERLAQHARHLRQPPAGRCASR